MIDTPEILQATAQKTAVLHIIVPRQQIRSVMGPGLKELLAVVAAQGVALAGPWFSHHLRLDPEVYDFEISVPVDGEVKPEGRVRASELPAVLVARTVYRGRYEGLGDGWGEFRAWVKQNGHVPAPDLWECYLSGPDASADPYDWRTQLNQPLLR